MRISGIDIGSPVLLRQGPDAWEGPAHQTRRGRRVAHFLGAAALAAIAGVALVFVEPALVVGSVLAIACVVVIVARPFWGLLLYAALFLLQPGELYPVLAPLHIERVVGAVALAALFLQQQRREGRIFIDGSRQTLLLFLFLMAALASVPFAYWRAEAVGSFVELLKIATFYLLVVHLVDTPQRLRAFLWVFSMLILYIAGTAFVAYLQGSWFYAQGIERAVGRTSAAGDPNQLGTTLAAAIPLFLVLALHRPFGWKRLFFMLGTPLLIATMAITGSRASLLGFLGGMTYLWWVSKRRILVGIFGLLLIGAGFLILPEQYRGRYSSITESGLDESSQGRIAAWKKGVEMVMDRPLCGVGIGCFGTAHALGYSPESQRSYLRAHSLYVQVFAELGVIGALVFFAFLLEFLRLNRRVARTLAAAGERWRLETTVLNGVFAGFVVLLLAGIFGHSLLRRTWYIYAALGLSILRLYLSDPRAQVAAGAEHPGRT